MNSLTLNKSLKYILVGLILVSFYFQHNYGIADNGDFIRSMGMFSSEATGKNIDTSVWPAIDAKNVRYYSYWLPYWQFEWGGAGGTSFTSTQLLWLPGAILNYFLYSKTILLMPAISLFPKLLLILAFLLFFKWAESYQEYKTLLFFCLGIPLAFMLSNSAYIAYLNSFFQEAGSFVYILIHLITLIAFYRKPNFAHFIVCIISLFLLSTVRQANIYWPFITIPTLVYLLRVKTRIKLGYIFLLGCTLLFGIAFISFINARVQYNTWQSTYKVNQYNSIFLGVLRFSKEPITHLKRLNMGNAANCVEISPYSEPGLVCFDTYQDQLSFLKVLNVIIYEPKILLREVRFAASEMQDITIEYLGKYSIYDPMAVPRVVESVNHRYLSQSEMTFFNTWANLKYIFFPRKYFLLLYLVISFIFFLYNLWRGSVLFQELSLIGLVATIATFIDMTVAILAGGVIEVIKHLFSANFLFDISLVALWGLTCLFIKTKIFQPDQRTLRPARKPDQPSDADRGL